MPAAHSVHVRLGLVPPCAKPATHPQTVSVVFVQAASTVWFAPHTEHVVQLVEFSAVEKLTPVGHAAQWASLVAEQAFWLAPAGQLGSGEQSVQVVLAPEVPLLAPRATACVDHVWSGQARQLVSAEAEHASVAWPAAQVLGEQEGQAWLCVPFALPVPAAQVAQVASDAAVHSW